MTNKKMNNLYENLVTLQDTILPCQISFAVKKNLLSLETALKPFFQERAALVQRYGAKDDKNELIVKEDGTIDIRNGKEYLKELSVLEAIDCKGFVVHRITKSDLSNVTSDITPRQLGALMELVKE